MEIIHIILGKANPDRMNGINKVVYQLATQQALAGKRVVVWGVTKDVTHNYGERVFKTTLFKACKNPFCLHKSLIKSIKSLNGNTVVHLHGGWVPLYYPLAKLLKKQKIPFVLTAHGAYNTIAMQRSSLIKKLYFRLFEHKVLKAAYKIHCIGESEVRGLNGLFTVDKAVLLPYGFETVQFETTSIAPHEFIVGFVGRIDIYTKGLDLLLSAFRTFNDKHIDSKLWIIGSSNEMDALKKRIIEQGLQHSVVLWGSKFGDEKENLMRQMAVFAHPSRNEGLPASVLEAAALGIPSLVSKATNIGSFIKNYNAGIVVDDEDVDGLSSALFALKEKFDNKSLAEMGLNGRRMVAESFNWNTIIKGFDNIYS